MKNKKCPYCGRRITYYTIFRIKNRGTYDCERCGKKSKVKVDNKLIISFIALCLAIILFMIFWNINLEFSNNFWGVVIVAAAVFIFYMCTPLFVKFVPIRKIVEENRRKTAYEYEENETERPHTEEAYTFNRKAFDEIKKAKTNPSVTTVQKQAEAEDKINNLVNDIQHEHYVPIIEDVSEAHASSTDMPLQKVSHTNTRTFEKQHIPQNYEETEDIEREQFVKREKRPDGSKYTANRKL